MLCDKCQQRQATVHVTQVINNQQTEAHYCAECAQEEGVMPIAGHMFSVHDFLKGFFVPAMTTIAAPQQAVRCPVCNLSFEELVQGGRFGCSRCYETFREAAPGLIRRIHGAKRHSGKIPRRSGGAIALRQELTTLKKTLEQHVAKEEYEEAAKVRDQIRELEKRTDEAQRGQAS